MMPRTFLFFLFSFFSAGVLAQTACDTLFKVRQEKISDFVSPEEAGVTKENILARFYQPEGYLYDRKTEDGRRCWLVFRSGKSWRGWDAGFYNDDEYNLPQVNWKQVDGQGGPELVIWKFYDFGHHSATNANEQSDYEAFTWNIETAELLLALNFRSYSHWYWSDEPDPGPSIDERLDLRIAEKTVYIKNESARERSFSDTALFEEKPVRPCPLPNGTYVLKNKAWVKISSSSAPRLPALPAPRHKAYWER